MLRKWQVNGLHSSSIWFRQPLKHAKRHQDHSNRQTDLSSKTEPMYMQNAGHLETYAILDFRKLTQLQEIIPVAFKTNLTTPRSFKSAEFSFF